MTLTCPPLPLLLPFVPQPGRLVTQWFPASASPVWPGEYEVRFETDGHPIRAHFDGSMWGGGVPRCDDVVFTEWRGVQL